MSKRKPYKRELSNDWWLKHAFYTKYIIREGSSVLITFYSLVLAWGVLRLSQGEVAFNAWLSALQHPISIIIHLLAFALALYHSITWFSLAPKAADLWFKGKKVEDKVIVNAHYAVFAFVSIFCLVIVMI